MVFALSITPKRFLHEVFAKHSDSKSKKNHDKPYQLINSGYNCDSDNLVAESTFLSGEPDYEFHVFYTFPSYIFKNSPFSSLLRFYTSLRGPPVIS